MRPKKQQDMRTTNAGAGRSEQPALDNLEAFSFEKDLLSDLSTKIQESTSNFLDSALEMVSGEDTSSALQSARTMGRQIADSSASQAAGDIVRRGADLGIDATTRLGRWAGGSMLSPGQASFIAAFVCIVRRRGIATFVGSLAVIRLYRLIMSLEEKEREWESRERELGDSVSSYEDEYADNEDSIDSRSIPNNDGGAAL